MPEGNPGHSLLTGWGKGNKVTEQKTKAYCNFALVLRVKRYGVIEPEAHSS